MNLAALASFDLRPAQRLPARTGAQPLRPRRPRTVHIGGWALNPLVLDCPELDKLGAVDLPGAALRAADGDGPTGPLRGVLLHRLLLRAEPAFVERQDFRRVAVVAESCDGDRALFSWSELFHTAVGGGVYLVFDGAGARLGPDQGPYALVSLRDRENAPRCIRRLASVDIHKLW